MAFIGTIITDPDDLNTSFTSGTGNLLGHYYTDEIHINAVDKTFHFKGGGNLNTAGDGATGQALYSFLKDRWQDTAAITAYDFPMLSITNEQFEFIDNWIPDDGARATATDLTFADDNPDTITTAGEIDFTDYFKAGDTLDITNSPSNDQVGLTIEIVSSTVLTLASGDVLVAEGPVTATLTTNIVTQGAFATTTTKLVRSAGWSEVLSDNTVNKRFSGVVTLGALVDNTDQPYFAQDSSFTANTENTTYTGPVNEPVRIYSHVLGNSNISFDGSNGITSTGPRLDVFSPGDSIVVTNTSLNNTTYTVLAVVSPFELTIVQAGTTEASQSADIETDLSAYFKIYVRERGKLYADSDLIDIGVTTMTYIVYRFPVSNATDLNLETSADTEIDNVTTNTGILTDIDFSGVNTITAAAGLGGFVDADLIKIVGSSSNDGFYSVNGSSSATTITVNETLNVVDDTGLLIYISADGVADVSPYEVIDVEYLKNPDTGTGVVNITGDWQTGFTYALGDVAYDDTDSQSDGDPRWYFVDATTGVSTGGDMAADTGNTWTIWDKANGFGERWINSAYYAFSVVIDANNTVTAGDTKGDSPYTHGSGGDKENIYDWAQWSLRQTDFIDVDASRNGNIADLLAEFVGSTLETVDGVFIDDLAPGDTNAVIFNDWAGIPRSYPLVVTVDINFNSNLSTDADAVFYAYYKDPDGVVNGNEFGTTGALQVVKSPSGNVGSDISNNVPDGATGSTYQFSYAYDGDTTGGRTVSTETDIVVVAIGLGTGQYVQAEGTITATGATVSLVAPLERNYSNP
jgi:hypothetical protein